MIVLLTQLVACISLFDPPPFVHEPTNSYESREVHGFTVMISQAARAHADTTDPAMKVLDAELEEVAAVIPAAALESLKQLRIWVEHDNPDRPCACYHPDVRWLRANGYNTEKVDSVEISNTRNFVSWVNRTQPMMVLHELAHGYHDVVFGYDDAVIKTAYEHAKEAGRYEEVSYIHGGKRRHYALTNQMEYFAELSESYFGKNDFFPFTREELKQFDPLGYAVIEAAWSVDPTEHEQAPATDVWFDVNAFEHSTPQAVLDLLIIAPQLFAHALQPYVHWKQDTLTNGAAFVTLEALLESQFDGEDAPECMKRQIFDRWQQSGLHYVLLVGDADVMPVRYMVLDRNTDAAFNYAFYPSDLYYADLAKPDGSFEDWNAQRDDFHAQYFGEVRGEHHKTDPINFDAIDYRPDVAVGRWPVSSIDEVKTLVGKSIAFESSLRNQSNASEAAPPVVAFIACGGWIENRALMDANAKQLEECFSIERRYFVSADRNDGTPPPDAKEIIELINGGATMIFHSGHGSDNHWHESFGVGDLSSLSNSGHPAILFSAGCSTARFATLPPYEGYIDVHGIEHAGTNDGEVFEAPPPPPATYQTGKYNPTGLGEQLLRASSNGAVVYIGCNTGSQPCGMSLMDGFCRAIGTRPSEVDRLGDAWNTALAFYYENQKLDTIAPTESWYPASIFFQGMKFMFFGDPSLPLPSMRAR